MFPGPRGKACAASKSGLQAVPVRAMLNEVKRMNPIVVGGAVVLLFFLATKFFVGIAPRERVTDALDKGAAVIDVRTPAEYARGHYRGAVNIPLGDLTRRMDEVGDKERPVIVYCASGGRSGVARRMLMKSGYTNVLNAGGLKRMPGTP
jgi:phage shock protein E